LAEKGKAEAGKKEGGNDNILRFHEVLFIVVSLFSLGHARISVKRFFSEVLTGSRKGPPIPSHVASYE
jgi:hypothetical protein